MKILRFGAAACLVLAAVFAALLASDVRAWQRTMRSDDVLLATTKPSTHLPASISEGLIGVRSDLALRHALKLFRDSALSSTTLTDAVDTSIRRARVETALAVLLPREHDRERQSQVSTLLGILAYGDFARGDHNPSQTGAVIGAFQSAVEADPTNEDAKYDLELVLRVFSRRGVGSGFSSNSAPGAQGHRGAGGGASGSGY